VWTYPRIRRHAITPGSFWCASPRATAPRSDSSTTCSRRAFGLILRVLVNRALSEEVLQDVFLEVWQSASGFAPNKGQGRSWVLTIAHRRAVDRVRSTRASTERDEKAGLRELNSGQDSVDDQVALRIESRRVARAMDAFPMRSAKHCCCRMSGDILRARSPHWWDRPWGRSKQECATVCRA
jgi:RNA polymerase sigma factor (sigma-70 family)